MTALSDLLSAPGLLLGAVLLLPLLAGLLGALLLLGPRRVCRALLQLVTAGGWRYRPKRAKRVPDIYPHW